MENEKNYKKQKKEWKQKSVFLFSGLTQVKEKMIQNELSKF